MIKVAKFVARHLILTTFLVIVLIALLLSAARVLTPLILEQYAGEIALSASGRFGKPVTVGGVQASWKGVGPVLVLSDVRLWEEDRSRTVLNLDEITVDFGLADMLATGFLAPGRINVNGLHLTIIRQPNGEITVQGIAPGGGGGDATALLLAPARLRLSNSRVVLEDRLHQRPPLALDDVNISIRNDESRHQIDADATLAEGRLRLRTDIHGTLNTPLNQWSGEIYARSDNLPLNELLRPELPADYQLTAATGSFQLWGEWGDGRLDNLSGEVAVTNFAIAGALDHSLDIDRIGGVFDWHRTDAGWQLDVDRLDVELDGHQWPEGRLQLRHSDAGTTAEALHFRSDYLDLADLITALRIRPPDEGLAADLIAARPKGELRDIDLRIRPRSGHAFSLKGSFSGLGAISQGALPAFDNLEGEFSATNNGGRLDLKGQDISLFPAKWFRRPIPVEELIGTLTWERRNDGWRIDTPAFSVTTPHITTLTRMRLDLSPGNSPEIDLQTDFRDGMGSFAPLYYPTSVMRPGLVRWLENSVIDAHIPWGSCIIRGPLADFPFHKTHNGHFEVYFGVEDAYLDYLDEWPPLDHLVAEVRFHNNSLTITNGEAEFLSSQLSNVEARFATLKPRSPMEMKGNAYGPLKDVLRILGETPLKKRFHNLVKGADADGDSRLALEFVLPMKTQVEGTLAGELEYLDADLRNPDLGLDLKGINGKMQVTHEGLSANGLKAVFTGSPVRLSVRASGTGTKVSARGKLNAERVMRQYPVLDFLPIQGTSPWKVNIAVPPANQIKAKPLVIEAASSLEGSTVDLPLQLGKPADGELAFKSRTEISRGLLGNLDARLGTLTIEGYPVANGWQGKLDSPTASGRFFLPSAKSSRTPIRADFDHLAIEVDLEAAIAKASQPSLDLKPDDFPEVDLTATDTLINGHSYGVMTARTRRSDKGIRLEELKLRSPQGKLSITGEWLSTPAGQSTALDIAIQTLDLGTALKDLALSGSVAEGSGHLDARIGWQGPPNQWQKETLSGDLQFEAIKGRFEETEPGVARLFGLLNITALQRRLRLDFSDLFQEGFAFDEIGGTFSIQNGIASTEDARILSPSGRIRISGTTNLVTSELDQNAEVIPAISGAVALAGTITGGPMLGAAILAAGRGIDRIATARYRITGPWDSPIIERSGSSREAEAEQVEGLPEIH